MHEPCPLLFGIENMPSALRFGRNNAPNSKSPALP
jgi:hypothetical protein